MELISKNYRYVKMPGEALLIREEYGKKDIRPLYKSRTYFKYKDIVESSSVKDMILSNEDRYIKSSVKIWNKVITIFEYTDSKDVEQFLRLYFNDNKIILKAVYFNPVDYDIKFEFIR